MKLENGEISSSQFMYLILGFLQGGHLLIAFASRITKHDTWIAVLAALAVCFPFVLIYVSLTQRFPGKSLIQIHDILYGPYLGKLISAIYLWYFVSLSALNLRTVGNFIRLFMLPETPRIAILVMFIFVCAWAVRNGIEVIARCSFIFVIITTMSILAIFILLMKDMKFTNFLPVFDIPMKDFIQGTHIIVSIPFSQLLTFIMITPYLNNIKQAKSSTLLGFILGGITLVIITIRDTAVLGIIQTIMTSPSFEAVRLIDIGKIITRLDILVAIGLLITLFLRVSIFYYVSVLCIAQLLKLRSYLPIVFPIGIITVCLAVLIYDSSIEQAQFNASIWPVYTIPIELLIPALSLIIAIIRRLPKKQASECR